MKNNGYFTWRST